MDRQQALDLLNNHLKAENLRKHCLATEAIMRALAERLDEPVDLWGVTGLLHDLDYEETAEQPSEHGLRTAAILADSDLPPEAIGQSAADYNRISFALESFELVGRYDKLRINIEP